MRTLGLLRVVLIILASLSASAAAIAQQNSEPATVTLYSPIKYQQDQSRAFFDFQNKILAQRGGRWDLGYGSIYLNENFDWFQSSAVNGSRSVIKDLGKHAWSDKFNVPSIKPLGSLKPGEPRQIIVDLSGRDDIDRLHGARGEASDPGVTRDSRHTETRGTTRPMRDFGEVIEPTPAPAPFLRPKGNGKSGIGPAFVKAIVGHIYAIHVVDDERDFYTMFRVEALTRGDNCTISWRLISAPPTSPKSK